MVYLLDVDEELEQLVLEQVLELEQQVLELELLVAVDQQTFVGYQKLAVGYNQ